MAAVENLLPFAQIDPVPREQETPLYSLFGMAPGLLEPQYYHVERVSDRSALHLGKVLAHSHPHLHQLSLWTKGGGRYVADDSVYPIIRGTLCWMPSGTIHGFEIAPDADAIVLSISGDFARKHVGAVLLDRPDRLLHSHAVVAPGASNGDDLIAWFEAIEREYRRADWGQSVSIGAWSRLIFVELVRRLDETGDRRHIGSPRSVLLSRFLEVLEGQLRMKPSVEQIAAMLGTTPYLLNCATREAMGMRASDVIRTRIMQEARRLLLFTMISVSDVGEIVGYADPAHFARAFKAYTGEVPSVWRAERIAALERSRTASGPTA